HLILDVSKYIHWFNNEPYDNAKIESFHSLLKREMIYQFRFPSIAHLILDVSKYIHWFNNERISLANPKIKVA
ncbi:IS3 family transposase, partial [Leuconostoc mesenteroides]|uniref:IS3 family transposase n=1 Tax=Leuconostoc mesenteroides TaxID=1245 RepID=UPI00117B2394